MAFQENRPDLDRLRQAIAAETGLDCAQADEQLPALVQAEAAGVDVDATAAFAALLRHLDRCASCAARYAALVADLQALAAADEAPPLLAPPTFFAPQAERHTERITLRIWQGMARTLELRVTPPTLAHKIPTLGGQRDATLFADHIAELPGTPLLAVTLTLQGESALLRVAVRDLTGPTRWQVRLLIGAQQLEQQTDEHGLAEFAGLPLAGLDQIQITCTELV